jgi:hypothetical protein
VLCEIEQGGVVPRPAHPKLLDCGDTSFLLAGRQNVVEFLSDGDTSAVLRLAFERASFDPDLGNFNVRIEAGGLVCEHGVLTTWKGDGLDRFFADLVENWRGWQGTRRWDALENAMSIEATHRGRVVELLFILRRDYRSDAWQVRLPILVAPGESLRRIASATASLFQESP